MMDLDLIKLTPQILRKIVFYTGWQAGYAAALKSSNDYYREIYKNYPDHAETAWEQSGFNIKTKPS